MLSVRRVSKHFGGVRALDGVTFSVSTGEAAALIGRNGSGKSTCLDLITGRGSPTSGKIQIDGLDVPANRPWWTWHRGVSRSFQRTPLVAGTTCEDYVLTGLLQTTSHFWRSAVRSLFLPLAAAASLRTMREAAGHALDRVGLAEKSSEDVISLAHEERRFLELARATAHLPRLVLLDEPAAGLSPSGIARLAGFLRSVHREGMTLIVVDHVLELCRDVTDRAILLSSGNVVFDGPWHTFDADAACDDYMNGGVARVA